MCFAECVHAWIVVETEVSEALFWNLRYVCRGKLSWGFVLKYDDGGQHKK